MDTPRSYPAIHCSEKPQHSSEQFDLADPWSQPDTGGQARRDNWMLSYIDILTVLLTLFVLLLVLQPKYESPAMDGLPELAGLASLTPIERPPAPVQKKPINVQEAPFSIAEAVGNETLPGFSAGLATEAAAPVVEMEISIEMLGGVPFFALQSFVPQTAIAETLAQTPADEAPKQQAEKPPANTAGTASPELSRDSANHAESNAFDEVLTQLTERRLDQRLKISQIAEGVQLELRDNILFALGSDKLKPEGRRLLDELAAVLLQHQGVISVEGHSDNRPISSTRFPSNWELSSGRATTVTRYLIRHGLDSTTLRAVGYADTRPLESNATRQGRARNRRVSLILELPKSG